MMSSLLHKQIKWLAAGLILAGLLTQFQNCGAMRAQTAPQEKEINFGGGTGYDGKIFAILSATECSDRSFIKSRIVIEGANAKFLRDGCADLPSPLMRVSPATVQGQSVQVENKSLDLEALPLNLPGEFVSGPLGEFAPSLNLIDLGPVQNIRGTTLGNGRLLTINSDGIINPLTLTARLHTRTGMAANLNGDAVRQINAISFGDDNTMNPLTTLAPIGDSDAALVVKISATQSRAVHLHVESNLPQILPESSDLILDAVNVGAQIIDGSRTLLWYRRPADQTFAFRILKLDGGAMALGPELSGPGSPFSLGTDPEARIAFMPEGAGRLRLLFSANGFSTTRLVASSDALSFDSAPTALSLPGGNPSNPVMAGIMDDGFLVYQADVEGTTLTPNSREYRWTRLTSGSASSTGIVNNLWSDTSLMESPAAAPSTLIINNRGFFNLPFILGASRIVYLAGGANSQKFTIELPGGIFQGSEVMGQDDNLIAVGVRNGRGYMSLISTPK